MRFNYDPFEEMERLLDQTRRSMGRRYEGGIERLTSSDVNLGMEPTDDGYVVTADMPGFEREDIDLRIQDDVLTIHAEFEVSEEHEGGWHRRSRRVHEELTVPGTVIRDDIEATYRNGVLEVHLPVEEDVSAGEHRIAIE